jgi:hypothetical protein
MRVSFGEVTPVRIYPTIARAIEIHRLLLQQSRGFFKKAGVIAGLRSKNGGLQQAQVSDSLDSTEFLTLYRRVQTSVLCGDRRSALREQLPSFG